MAAKKKATAEVSEKTGPETKTYINPNKRRWEETVEVGSDRHKEIEGLGWKEKVVKAPAASELAAQQVTGVGMVTSAPTNIATGTPGTSANPTGTVTTTNG
jgi:hypothetical protein